MNREEAVTHRLLVAVLPRNLTGIVIRSLLLLVILAAPVYVFLSNFATFEPYLYPLHMMQGEVRAVGPEVIVGPYPDYGLLSDLHGRGVRTIISLLDRHLIYENSLIRREDLYAGQLGIRELNFPMDSSEPPSSPLNAMALHNIRSYLARHPRTVVYIHCYLGKHRVGDVVQMLHGPQAGSAVARAGRGRD